MDWCRRFFFTSRRTSPQMNLTDMSHNVVGTIGKDEDVKIVCYSYAEVAKHNTRDSAWMIVDGRVIDVTNYVKSHPGDDSILNYAGRDATIAIQTHPSHAFSMPFIEKKSKDLTIGVLQS